jgi:hypothetical protein
MKSFCFFRSFATSLIYWFLGPSAQELQRCVLFEIYAPWSSMSNMICTKMDKDENGQHVMEEAMSTLPPPRVIVVSLIICIDGALTRNCPKCKKRNVFSPVFP